MTHRTTLDRACGVLFFALGLIMLGVLAWGPCAPAHGAENHENCPPGST